jgi:hypothetical protein
MKQFYVYRIYDEGGTLYVGKGVGTRLAFQTKRFKALGEIIEVCKGEGHAFKRECYWIEQFKPPLNKTKGGGGRKRSKPRPRVHIYRELQIPPEVEEDRLEF